MNTQEVTRILDRAIKVYRRAKQRRKSTDYTAGLVAYEYLAERLRFKFPRSLITVPCGFSKSYLLRLAPRSLGSVDSNLRLRMQWLHRLAAIVDQRLTINHRTRKFFKL